jgi:hypothetical protein
VFSRSALYASSLWLAEIMFSITGRENSIHDMVGILEFVRGAGYYLLFKIGGRDTVGCGPNNF